MNKEEMRTALLQAGWTNDLIDPFLSDEAPWQPTPTVAEIAADLIIDAADVTVDSQSIVSSGEFLAVSR